MLDSRYASAMLVSQDHDILWTKYPSDAGKNGIQILPSDVPTDKLMLGLRIFTNGSESDLPNVHELQDAFRIEPIGGSNGDGSSNVSSVDNQNNNYNFTVAQRCKASAQNYITREAGRWDRDSLNSVAALLKELDKHSNSTKDEMFGPDWKTLNYLYYLFGVAVGWGGMEGKV